MYPMYGPTKWAIEIPKTANVNKDALNNINLNGIDKIIQKIFLPIQPMEYLMEPELFDVRLALSD